MEFEIKYREGDIMGFDPEAAGLNRERVLVTVQFGRCKPQTFGGLVMSYGSKRESTEEPLCERFTFVGEPA